MSDAQSSNDLLNTIREQCKGVGFDWPSNDNVRTGPPERVIYHDEANVRHAVWHRSKMLRIVDRQAAEIERLTSELKVQKAVNDLAYIPHRHLVESRDNLQAKHDTLEREIERLRAGRENAQRINDNGADEIMQLRGALEMIYDKWEDGTSCYEDPEDCTGYLGHAVKLSEAEEQRILDLLPTGCTRSGHETSASLAPDWAIADKATGEVWIGEYDEAGNWLPPKRTEMRPAGENHSTAVRTGAHRESGETGSAGGPSPDRICEQPEAAHGDGCRPASAQCKHDWVGDDNCAYCRAEDAEAETARLRAHIFNGEEFVLDLVNADGEPPTELLVWAREWVACNLGAEPDDVRLAKEKERS